MNSPVIKLQKDCFLPFSYADFCIPGNVVILQQYSFIDGSTVFVSQLVNMATYFSSFTLLFFLTPFPPFMANNLCLLCFSGSPMSEHSQDALLDDINPVRCCSSNCG